MGGGDNLNIFRRAVNWLTGLFNRQNLKEAFGIEHVAISEEMLRLQELYRQIVRGRAPWNDKDTPSLKRASIVSAEVTRKVVVGLECKITGGVRETQDEHGNTQKVSLTNPRSEYLNEQFSKFIKNKLRTAVNAACNGGEIIFKPYVSNGGIEVTVVETDCYKTLTFNTRDELIDAAFGASIERGEYAYRLLERHVYDEEAQTHEITYKAYRNERTALGGFTPEGLGEKISVKDVPEWAHLEDITISGITQPLFVHFRMPTSDVVESPQRHGLPIWSKAVSKLEEADVQNRIIRREYKLGRQKILASIDFWGESEESQQRRKSDTRKPPNRPNIEFAPDDADVFVWMNDGAENVPITHISPELRFTPLNEEMNRIDRDIELLSGLSFGIISDAAIQDKTATEVRASKDRFFTTVSDIQDALEIALRHLIASFNVLADLQDIPQGNYEVGFTWDDSIMADREREFEERKYMLSVGAISPAEFRAWYFNISVEVAQKQIDANPRLKNELAA